MEQLIHALKNIPEYIANIAKETNEDKNNDVRKNEEQKRENLHIRPAESMVLIMNIMRGKKLPKPRWMQFLKR